MARGAADGGMDFAGEVEGFGVTHGKMLDLEGGEAEAVGEVAEGELSAGEVEGGDGAGEEWVAEGLEVLARGFEEGELVLGIPAHELDGGGGGVGGDMRGEVGGAGSAVRGER